MATQTQRDLFLKYMKSLVFWRKNSKINDNIFWECHKILRNHPHRSDIYQVKVKSKWAIFSNFVALSENLNFNAKSRTQEAQWQNAHQKATTPTTPTSPQFIRLICPNCSKHLGYVGKKPPGRPSSVEVIIGRSSVAFFPAPKTIQKKIQVMPFHHLHNGLIYICMSYNFCSVTCTVGNVKTIVEF